MDRQPPSWNRYQWTSESGVPSPAARDLELARWSSVQWASGAPLATESSRPRRIESADDGLPHGFSGFGVADSGGQRWASLPAPAPELESQPSAAVDRAA